MSRSYHLSKVMPLVLIAFALSCRPQPEPGRTVAPSPAPTPVAVTGPAGFPPAVLGKPYPGTGIVKIVNRKEGWVEIDHDEIKDLMPAMEMEFWIRDSSLMNGIRVGDRVAFVVMEDNKGEYLTELKRISPGH